VTNSPPLALPAELIDANYAAGTFSLRIAKQLSGAIPAGRIYEGYFEDWGSCVATMVAGDANGSR
jgi:hypothetical protein